MSDLTSSPLTILTCTLAMAGWIVAFVGLCTSYTFAKFASWWIIAFEFLIISFSCTVFWTSTTRTHYPVILCLIAISIPYAIDEITLYVSSGRASLSAATSGYIIIIVTQFAWIFMLGVQQHHPSSILRSFSDFNRHSVYSNSTHHYQKDQYSNSNIVFANNNVPLDADYTGPGSEQRSYLMPAPLYTNVQSQEGEAQNTVFLSPHLEYRVPVVAIHSYHANKEDPNELSFSKGEVLLIHEKRGSWWQAKKSSGEIGMVPSNYVTDHQQTSVL